MPDTRRCNRCGNPLPPDAPYATCLACMRLPGRVPESGPTAVPTGEERTFGFGPVQPGHVLESLARSIGSVPRVLLLDTTHDATEVAVIRPSTDAMPSPADRGGRYHLFGEIARGGMGSVLVGRDPDLGREVAIKVLREDLRDNDELVRRFVEEAQIGGQLQHPGVVPIYELGTFADHRPFFCMKYVKGQTLASLLAARSDPADDRPRFLAIFAAIAQTIAYAHTRGVIHRDLKPSNVMVGSFGEVQVMDWGLAKVLGREGVLDDATAGNAQPGETLLATTRSDSDKTLSRAGSVMGTPSYMAPEQARGENDRVDERADVFALGSILCEILTGAPAFQGPTSTEILRQAARGDTADALARLEACGADAELVSMTSGCLASDPVDRPEDAQAVSASFTAYLDGVQDRLRQSELAEATAKARAAEEAKRRRLTVVLAATALLALISGGGGYVWNQQQKAERQAKTAHVVNEALADAARLRGEAQAARPVDPARWAEAISAARRAEGLLAQGEANAPLKGLVNALLAQLGREQAAATEQARRLSVDRALLAGLEALRGRRAEHLDPKQTDADYAAAFQKAGLVLDATLPAEAGKWLAARSEPVELAGYLDDWYLIRKQAGRPEADWRRLVEAARAADPDPWRDALRAKVSTSDERAAVEFRRLADDAKALDGQSAPSLILLARQLHEGVGERERAARVLRRAVSRHPADFWAHVELARLYGADSGTMWEVHPEPEEAVRQLTAAVAIRPNSPMAHGNFGLALESQGKLDEAVPEYREAIRLKPEDNSAHFNLFAALKLLGKMDEAMAACREAIRNNPNDPYVHFDMGLALREQGEYAEAVAAFRQSIRLKPVDARFHNNLGLALIYDGKLDGSIAAFRDAIRIKPDFTEAHMNLGLPLFRLGRLDEALTEYREAIRLKPNFAVGHDNLGVVLEAQGKREEALASYRRAGELAPPGSRVAEAIPGRILGIDQKIAFFARLPALLRGEAQPGSPDDRLSVAELAYDRKHFATAARLWAEALEADPKLGDDRRAGLRYQAACAASLTVAGQDKDDPRPDDATRAKRRVQALDWLKAELAAWTRVLDSGPPQTRATLTRTLRHWKQDTDLAGIREAESLAQLPEAERRQWQALWAAVDSLLKRVPTTMAKETKSDTDDSDTLDTIHRRAHALARAKPAEAEPLFRQALAGFRKTQGPDGHLTYDLTRDLASLLEQTGRVAEAEPLFRDALRIGRKRFGPADPRTVAIMAPLGLGLIQQGKWTEAEPVLRETLAIREKLQPDEWSTFLTRSLLGGSLLGQKKYAEAESLIIAGYGGMKAREARIPPAGRPRLNEAAARLVKLYEAWGKNDKAAEWRARLAKPSDESRKPP